VSISRLRSAAALLRLAPWFFALGLVKRHVPLPILARWLYRSRPSRPGQDPTLIASRVLRAGALAGVPDRDCLQRSLVLYRELSAAGMAPELAVGFRHVDGRLTGHAWVSVEGSVVAEPGLELSAFTQIARFGRGGAIVHPDA
jgi:hypothetical protein